MKRILLGLFLCFITLAESSFMGYSVETSAVGSFTSLRSASSSSYDIVEIYQEVRVDSGAKVIDSYGDLKDVKKLLVPTRLDNGKYTVKVTRIDSNIYQICDTNYYIQTRYCYEYATREEVVVSITSAYGYTKGEIIFF